MRSPHAAWCQPQLVCSIAHSLAPSVLLGPAVSAAEDPEKILDQAVADMQNDLIRLRQAAAEVRRLLLPAQQMAGVVLGSLVRTHCRRGRCGCNTGMHCVTWA